MPIYQYRCKKCNHEVEVLQGVNEPLLTECEACQQPALEKCMSATCFRLSGSGYYETDEKPKDKQRYLASGRETACDTNKCA